jgi:hypothetical protein
VIDHSELPAVLGATPTRSLLVHELVESGRAFTETSPDGSWEDI